jgi:hypothetical protein
MHVIGWCSGGQHTDAALQVAGARRSRRRRWV